MTPNTTLFDGMVVFTEVIKAGSFSAAADTTGHSTSYISKEISKLESRLGTRLINRTTRSLGLTPEGQAFFDQCILIINDTENAINLVNQQSSDPKGRLKISCPVSLGLTLLRPIFGDFLKQHPKITLDLDVSDRQVDVIAEGFDIVVRAKSALEDSSLISRRLFSSRGYTIASPSYLKEFGTPTTPQDLKDHRCISYSSIKNPTQWPYTNKSGNTEVVDVQDHVMCNSAEMELELAMAGYGVTRVPGFNISNEIKDGRLVSLFEDYTHMNIDVFLVYPSRKHLSPKVRAFIDFTVAYVESREL